jgi:hypothetical protein
VPRWLTLVLFVGAVALCSSCTGRWAARTVLKRATFDLACEGKDLKLTKLSTKVYGVEGCGKRATYVTVGTCETEGGCNAVMNTHEGEPTGQPTPE